MKLLRLCIVYSALFLLTGCSDGRTPPKSEAIEQISKYESTSNDAFSVDNFKYVNGFEKDANNYIVVASYDVTILLSSKEVKSRSDVAERARDNIKNKYIHSQTDVDEAQKIYDKWLPLSIVMIFQYPNAEKGDIIKQTKNYAFLKTERGWILQGVSK